MTTWAGRPGLNWTYLVVFPKFSRQGNGLKSIGPRKKTVQPGARVKLRRKVKLGMARRRRSRGPLLELSLQRATAAESFGPVEKFIRCGRLRRFGLMWGRVAKELLGVTRLPKQLNFRALRASGLRWRGLVVL